MGDSTARTTFGSTLRSTGGSVFSSTLGDYLRTRREQVTPEAVGLSTSGVRRVPGLRREEVAALAGISAEYYLRLEQGRDRQPSDQVLNALARALLLDESATQYLHRLARPDTPWQLSPHVDTVDDSLLHLLEQWKTTPAMIISSCQDILAVNRVAAEYAPLFFQVGRNLVIDVFTDPVKQIAPDWEWLARGTIAALRMAASPHDPRLIEIVGELSIRDADFRRLWARQDAQPMSSGPAGTIVEGLGPVQLRWQNLSIPRSGGQIITVFFGEAGSTGETALRAVAQRVADQVE